MFWLGAGNPPYLGEKDSVFRQKALYLQWQQCKLQGEFSLFSTV